MTLEGIITENNLNDFWIEGGTDKASEHSYCPYYEQLLTPYKDKECEILEVGCWQGGFVFAMSQLLPMAKFTTIDIQDKFSTRLFDLIGADRITNHQLVNAYCFKTLKLIEDKQFDIIIDDGTHLVHDEIFLLNNYMKFLKPDGKMVIEDLDYDNITKLMDNIDDTVYDYNIMDLRNVKGRGDDMLIEITRK